MWFLFDVLKVQKDFLQRYTDFRLVNKTLPCPSSDNTEEKMVALQYYDTVFTLHRLHNNHFRILFP
jgi:hypothetical protein